MTQNVVSACTAKQHVISAMTGQRVSACITVKRVVTRQTLQSVSAIAAFYCVIASVTTQRVVTGKPLQCVTTCAAPKDIITSSCKRPYLRNIGEANIYSLSHRACAISDLCVYKFCRVASAISGKTLGIQVTCAGVSYFTTGAVNNKATSGIIGQAPHSCTCQRCIQC